MAVYRAYPQLFAVRVRESATRVGELRPSLTQFGVEISTGDAKRRLESVDYAELVWVQSLLSEIQDRTFQEMMNEFKLQTGCSLEQFREEVKTLGLAHELVIHPRIDDVKFYVSTCNAAVTHDNRGVLLADAKSPKFVDRSCESQGIRHTNLSHVGVTQCLITLNLNNLTDSIDLGSQAALSKAFLSCVDLSS